MTHSRHALLSLSLIAGVSFLACSSSEEPPANNPGNDAGAQSDSSTSGNDGGINVLETGVLTDGSAPDGALPQYTGPHWKSGSRLKAKLYTTASGEKVFSKFWFDTSTKVDCSVGFTSDGKYRCIPSQLAKTVNRYSDASCTQPMAELFSPDVLTADSLYRMPAVAAQCSGQRLFRSGGVRAGVSMKYSMVNGTCTAAAAIPNATYYTLVDADLTVFAEMSATKMDISPKFSAMIYSSADGASQVGTLFDRGRNGALCSFFYDTGTCTPTRLAVPLSNTFGDNACSVPVAQSQGTNSHQLPEHCAQPPSAYYDGKDYAELKPAPTSVYANGPGGCAAAQTPAGTLYTKGSALSSSLVTISSDGSGALKVRNARDGAVLVGQPAFFDSTANERCSPSLTSLGWRCVPASFYTAPFVGNTYADAACTTPIRGLTAPPTSTKGSYLRTPSTSVQDPAIIGSAVAAPAKIYAMGASGCNYDSMPVAGTTYYSVTFPTLETLTFTAEP